ncbi:uncharacterized protein FTOL_08653 [Fusarium torulosum]|uniref:Uncharacterized protein n=1 Tax=Fusarium torulosum TaxID=33205 RepID=A0AAE8MD52_9HYPO|nr:uncharacterized protein FTOL_08653 [Fusarium torulosum]
MSASSGESGFCIYCGHFLNEHTKPSRSLCKNRACKKRFLICQAPVHNTTGWRICDIPCGCGSAYYPDNANAARPLEPAEYASTHPLSESPSSGGEAAPASDPIFVELWENNGYWEFGHNGMIISSSRKDWKPSRQFYEGRFWDCWRWNDYATWVLPSQSQQSTGKRVAYTHGRNVSSSTDPVTWTEERLAAETQMTSGMAGLALEGGSSYQAQDENVYVSARLYKKDNSMVEFKHNGQVIKSKITSWATVDDGFVFKSSTYGCTFFTEVIKPAKK